MFVRSSLLFAALAIASSTVACSSLTKPDEIQIWAEPPAPKPAPAAAAPAQPGAQPGRPAAGNSGG